MLETVCKKCDEPLSAWRMRDRSVDAPAASGAEIALHVGGILSVVGFALRRLMVEVTICVEWWSSLPKATSKREKEREGLACIWTRNDFDLTSSS